ncbi:hypothetical protein BX616_003339 [Lobosporangium transversale]|nr:hypothetical protein BX616_003339 [Lobosporangium transversale]
MSDRYCRLIFGIFHLLVISLLGFACIMGATWYIIKFVEVWQLGNARPFNILESLSIKDNGTPTPTLSLYTTEIDKIEVASVEYINATQSTPSNGQNVKHYKSGAEGERIVIVPEKKVLTDGYQRREYIQVVLKHSPVPSQYNWSQVTLLHPNIDARFFTSRDKFNQFYFLPGHFVEIRYTPLNYNEAYRPGPDASFVQRFKAFLGHGGQNETFSYRSTVQHMPFPHGMYDDLTTVLLLRPQSNVEIISYAAEGVTFRDTMANIGGLMGLVSSLIVFLFGASLASPWGLIADIPCFRRRITGSLAKAYDTHDGYSKGPFTTRAEDIGKFHDTEVQTQDQKIMLLKERIDELEMVLSDFYLSSDVFQTYAKERKKLKLARTVSVAHQRENQTTDITATGGSLSKPELEDYHPYHQKEHLGFNGSQSSEPLVQTGQRRADLKPSSEFIVPMSSDGAQEHLSLLSPSQPSSHAAPQYEHLSMSDLSRTH